MKKIERKGTAPHTLILLHGTGGDAPSMIPLGMLVDPNAHMVALQGNVSENGMARFFKRYPDGSFDIEDLNKQTEILKDVLVEIASANDENIISILGYSNGANIITNLLKTYPDLPLDNVMLLHPSVVAQELSFQPQKAFVSLSYGLFDPFISKKDFEAMVKQLDDAGIVNMTINTDAGHALSHDELKALKISEKRS